jgi:hypothetical protein
MTMSEKDGAPKWPICSRGVAAVPSLLARDAKSQTLEASTITNLRSTMPTASNSLLKMSVDVNVHTVYLLNFSVSVFFLENQCQECFWTSSD